MPQGYIPDTNILSILFEREHVLRRRLAGVEVYISTIVLGELFYGAFNTPYPPLPKALKNAQHFAKFGAKRILHTDAVTSERYGIIYGYLEQHGLPIQMNDVWIAAQAVQHDFTIVTRDSDFDHIPGIKIVRW